MFKLLRLSNARTKNCKYFHFVDAQVRCHTGFLSAEIRQITQQRMGQTERWRHRGRNRMLWSGSLIIIHDNVWLIDQYLVNDRRGIITHYSHAGSQRESTRKDQGPRVSAGGVCRLTFWLVKFSYFSKSKAQLSYLSPVGSVPLKLQKRFFDPRPPENIRATPLPWT